MGPVEFRVPEGTRFPSPWWADRGIPVRGGPRRVGPPRLALEDQTIDRQSHPGGYEARVDSRVASEEARSVPSRRAWTRAWRPSDRSHCGGLRGDRTWRRLLGSRGFTRNGFATTTAHEELLRARPQGSHPSVTADPGSEREPGRSGKGPGLKALGKPARLVDTLSGASFGDRESEG